MSKIQVSMKIKNYGEILLELYPEVAPNTVANFLTYVNENLYNGLIFHRVIKGFMIQGGGTHKNLKPIKGEFASNGFKNDLKHEPGVISMARTMMPNSATSQFFIMHKSAPHLDGKYAAFGKVIEGFEVVEIDNKYLESDPVYKGMHMLIQDSKGTIFEVQIHS